MYADDSKLIATVKTVEDKIRLQNDILNLEHWKISISKMQYDAFVKENMHFNYYMTNNAVLYLRYDNLISNFNFNNM